MPRTGALAVGARDFLVAYNINLNTTSTRRANAIAFDVRERGRVKREGNPLTGKIVKDADGKPVMIPGTLKAVKAIGWYIEEYGVAQISMNLTNISVTPVHIAFDEVCRSAASRGIRVTGSELVGLVPLKAMLDAGRYFLKKQKRSVGVSDGELIKIAVKSMGLDELGPFVPEEKIIEYQLKKGAGKTTGGYYPRGTLWRRLHPSLLLPEEDQSVPIWGPWVQRWLPWLPTFPPINEDGTTGGRSFPITAGKGKAIQEELLALVDEDTLAFKGIMEAFGSAKKYRRRDKGPGRKPLYWQPCKPSGFLSG